MFNRPTLGWILHTESTFQTNRMMFGGVKSLNTFFQRPLSLYTSKVKDKNDMNNLKH